jgi:hypothetical protein
VDETETGSANFFAQFSRAQTTMITAAELPRFPPAPRLTGGSVV